MANRRANVVPGAPAPVTPDRTAGADAPTRYMPQIDGSSAADKRHRPLADGLAESRLVQIVCLRRYLWVAGGIAALEAALLAALAAKFLL